MSYNVIRVSVLEMIIIFLTMIILTLMIMTIMIRLIVRSGIPTAASLRSSSSMVYVCIWFSLLLLSRPDITLCG